MKTLNIRPARVLKMNDLEKLYIVETNKQLNKNNKINNIKNKI